jgi:8-oxo-dGTP pyrophosphatase MutT (NUDIX family)
VVARGGGGIRGPPADQGAVRELSDLDALLARAKAEGKIVAVGAIIRDGRGRVFVHRRGPDRRFLPNCWDLVGGHVEAGEDLIAALRREVREETSWTVRGTPELMHVEDWVSEGVDGPEPHREFDFYVEVEGDLERPRLEVPKHVEFRWIGPGDTTVLDENRGLDEGFIRRIVERALGA